MPIFLIGLNHTTAPVGLRERLYFGGTALPVFLRDLVKLHGVEESLVLSTCNRTEVLVVADTVNDALRCFAEQGDLPLEQLHPHLYIFQDRDATSHLFRVACGLDSLVIGEMQILKQIRDALEIAREERTAGRTLTGLVQRAIAVGKRARAETAISHGAFSVGRAAVEMARSLFDDLTGSPVLILGAGKMSELTVKHLAASGVQSIIVANRTHAHAVELADRLGGRAVYYHELEAALIQTDIVISSTSAPHLVLHAETIARVMAQRQERPLCLIDIAVPRDIDPAAGALPGVHLYNVDDLQAVTEKSLLARKAEVPKVETIIHEEVMRWCCRQAGLDATPVITALRESFERIRRTELDRIAPMLATLAPEQRQAVEALTTAMVNKMLHLPTVQLKNLLVERGEEAPLALVCELFALEDALQEEVEV